MATIQGTGGNATIAGYNAKLNSWTASAKIETVETTGFSDSGFATNEPVIVSISGSASGTGAYTSSDPMPALTTLASATSVAIVLTAASGNTWSFQGVVTSVNFTRPNDGKLDISFDFESDGAVTQAWT